jgi:hypothetical protein
MRDSNGFLVTKIGLASFVTKVNVPKRPMECILIDFSKTTSNKLRSSIFCFYVFPCFCKRSCVVGKFKFHLIARVKKPLKSVFGRKGLKAQMQRHITAAKQKA